MDRLRPYQIEIAKAVMDSVLRKRGLTFSVEIARQGGKNELSAQLEMLILTLNMADNKNLVKCSPTFKPQTVLSMMRLKDKLNEAGFSGLWSTELGYIIRLGNARAIFLSAEDSANVVGNTAHLLLEVDEAQDVSREKFDKEFRPMGSTTNCTSVLYGTTWDSTTLLEEVKQTNLELERKDGTRRHFRYDWEEIARYNPDYQAYVEKERERLGENHPLFLTQYRLLPVSGGSRFLGPQQQAQLQGEHGRRRRRQEGKIYVAGIDLAGEGEEETGSQTRDATVVTIGELDYTVCDDLQREPGISVVEHYRWTGKKHTELYPQLVDLLKNNWKVKKAVVDATGIGQPVSAFLRRALGSRIVPFVFTAASKSELGFKLLAAINSGRLKMYAADDSPEYRELWSEVSKARVQYRANRTMNFLVNPVEGHDDFLMSLALVNEAGSEYIPREARGMEL